ncbi:hypothetical protein CISG_01119 [Coccidioides immitis RMSCC 3703]|uniref:Uncharacterized protein n=2 Tax=Coccidioides immitis TaxID=5501 RepID=A0A0J8QWE2_COCIT|nr:hypothetical protein CIRG_01778 [Coccidioides immitis RMSCC 2394]KMU76385.1 hypothetical protein CISG_01119 [Coccidioides immitis RMSCC 3703]
MDMIARPGRPWWWALGVGPLHCYNFPRGNPAVQTAPRSYKRITQFGFEPIRLPPAKGLSWNGSYPAGACKADVSSHWGLGTRFRNLESQQKTANTQHERTPRCLFRRIAREIQTEAGPFHLYCDDLRPSNVLTCDPDFMITGVIDWEFTYVAPAEFTYTAPWWLLLESPEAWESDLNAFLARYKPHLKLFLKVLRDCEGRQIRKGSIMESQRLSDRMAQSIENGLFWFCLAARKSFMFDDIYWTFLDKKHFGPLRCLDDRISLLTQQERSELDGFVQRKMQQAAEKGLDEHLTYDEFVDL